MLVWRGLDIDGSTSSTKVDFRLFGFGFLLMIVSVSLRPNKHASMLKQVGLGLGIEQLGEEEWIACYWCNPN